MTTINEHSKSVKSGIIVLLCLSSFVFGMIAKEYIVEPLSRPSSSKYFIYDESTNTLIVYGGSKENPITYAEISHALVVVKARNYPTIIINSTIVVGT